MDTTLTAALIGALVALLGLLAQQQRWRAERREAVPKERGGKGHGDRFLDTYGLRLRLYRSRGKHILPGTLKTYRELVCLTMTRDGVYEEISISTKESGTTSIRIGEPRLTWYNFPREPNLRLRKLSSTHQAWVLEVPGGLSPSDPALSARLEWDIETEFPTTLQQAKEQYAGDEFPYQFYTEDITMPLDCLVIEVELPSEWASWHCAAVAFYGHSEVVHPDEQNRASKGFRRGGDYAQLVVPEPCFGFRYGIYWIPEN